MTPAITEATWLATLERIKNGEVDDMTRTLAQMLYEIVYACNNREDIAEILDIYGSRLLGERR